MSCAVPHPADNDLLLFVRQTNPKPLLVFDNLREFMVGDTNDSQAMQMFMSRLRVLAHAGAPVVILHHVGKGESSRHFVGSVHFKADLDAGYVLRNVGGNQMERSEMTAFKTRIQVESKVTIRQEDLPLQNHDSSESWGGRDMPASAVDFDFIPNDDDSPDWSAISAHW
jgi:hypothetical protein